MITHYIHIFYFSFCIYMCDLFLFLDSVGLGVLGAASGEGYVYIYIYTLYSHITLSGYIYMSYLHIILDLYTHTCTSIQHMDVDVICCMQYAFCNMHMQLYVLVHVYIILEKKNRYKQK